VAGEAIAAILIRWFRWARSRRSARSLVAETHRPIDLARRIALVLAGISTCR